MAVNVGQRHVPNTNATKQLEACEYAKKLAQHTLIVCKNENIFKPEYREFISDECIKCAIDIYLDVDAANNIYIAKDNISRWDEREGLQRAALLKCRRLISMIGFAKTIYHLKSSKFFYWINLAIQTEEKIRAWHTANAKVARNATLEARRKELVTNTINDIDVLANTYIKMDEDESAIKERREGVLSLAQKYEPKGNYLKIKNLIDAMKLKNDLQALISQSNVDNASEE